MQGGGTGRLGGVLFASLALHAAALLLPGLAARPTGPQPAPGPLLAQLVSAADAAPADRPVAPEPAATLAREEAVDEAPPRVSAPPAPPSPEIAFRTAAEAPHYWPAGETERMALAVVPPDLHLLDGSNLPASNVRLRLYISAQGRVDEVEVAAANAAEWKPLREMFKATPFIPARRGGADVASFLDIEISIEELRRIL